MNVIEIKQNEFDEKVSNSDKKVLIDVYANWCGPCKMLSSIIDELSNEIDNINFYKLDIDKSEDIARRYGIMSIPTLLIFDNGELKEKIVGFKNKEELKEILNNN